ncbi:DNA recombination and repair protein RecF [hydrothermal vent metagenome]|uniref:DNA replication and repair protein RecF n=1 Tax=hydrothermal vent metagenome TaxID=652676 RepID=A0A3B0ZE87_9ZZZZ
MGLSYLSVINIRNVKNASLNPHDTLNIICGENGSGKTSLLEAIYYLGRTKSPRTRFLNKVVNVEENSMTVFARLKSNKIKQIGIEYKKREGSRLKIDGRKATAASEVAYALPLLYVGSDATLHMYRGANYRRRFIDWGVFHVEHRFLDEVKQFNRILKQRNAALKKKSVEALTVWDKSLVSSAEAIDSMRSEFIIRLAPLFKKYSCLLIQSDEFNKIVMQYDRGWQQDVKLQETLDKALPRDIEVGYTRYGPHRADMKLKINSRLVEDTASAGQLKLLVCALFLAQLELFNMDADQKCIILIDDLASELDKGHRNIFIELLSQLNTQIYVTTTDLDHFCLNNLSNYKVFHVKHGVVTDVVDT